MSHSHDVPATVPLFLDLNFSPESGCKKKILRELRHKGKKNEKKSCSVSMWGSLHARWPTYQRFYFLPACVLPHLSTSRQPVEPEKDKNTTRRSQTRLFFDLFMCLFLYLVYSLFCLQASQLCVWLPFGPTVSCMTIQPRRTERSCKTTVRGDRGRKKG